MVNGFGLVHEHASVGIHPAWAISRVAVGAGAVVDDDAC